MRKETNLTNMIERNETNQEVQPISFAQILEAIAKGVETRLKRTVVVNVVTLETIYIARKLHIPEEEIQEWRSSRCFRSESAKDYPFPQSMEVEK
jgi:hypothetical protein